MRIAHSGGDRNQTSKAFNASKGQLTDSYYVKLFCNKVWAQNTLSMLDIHEVRSCICVLDLAVSGSDHHHYKDKKILQEEISLR